MNSSSIKKLGVFMIIYIDDILVYSKIVEEHMEHLEYVLSKFRQNKFLPMWQNASLPKKKWIS